ncbi:serine/threonine protein kinase [Blastococcus sp. DSM 46786]|uniref:hypothetical protein n=1 Tax=Blastococcus sp. DSM 46786 TaxID=1798227 RepID=UPI0008B644EB|nr:hypothetical protein [Blastococcus sp. DSM 46786]SEK94020.1 serine/threonine protein kinase [Blastococcus sp. DSM 46786]
MSPADERRDPTARASEEPTVSTAPAAAPGSPADSASPAPRHGWWAAIPRRLGRARTSTVVLAVLFVAVFALWLNVKPPAPGATPPAEDTGVTEPTDPAGTTEPTQTEEAEPTEEPAPTTPQSEPTPRPTTTAPSSPGTTTTAPETTAPAPTGGTGEETAPGP